MPKGSQIECNADAPLLHNTDETQYGSLNSENEAPPPPYQILYPAQTKDFRQTKWHRMFGILRWAKYSVWISVSLAVVFALVNLVVIVPDIEKYVDKSLEVEVQDFEFDGIGKGFSSIDVNLKCATFFNYSKLDNLYLTRVFQAGSSVSKTVRLYPDTLQIDALDLFENDFVNLGSVVLPPIQLNISEHTQTLLDVKLKMKPSVKTLFKFLKSLSDRMNQIEDAEDLKVEFFFTTDLKLDIGSLPLFKTFTVKLDKEIKVSKALEYFKLALVDWSGLENSEVSIDNLLDANI